ncbi:cation transporter [Pediococcus stilesii]|uniref:Cation transporter n=1 Tax=Pediococcus stilesii TaxID=331679 RepID=A0A5R9BTU7_9LACO|nr:cation diffusion facilitator family transporter [Pediococcus stilesii]TLQ04084.1 cation transporter [Pediococcus stilesii]
MGDEKETTGVKFFEVTTLNLLITVAEFIGGIASGSLSLLSDAIHNLGDSASIVMAFIASKISACASNQSKTFGYRRAEILSSYFNSIFLIIMSAMLMWEAVQRLIHPEKVNGNLMLIVAVIGFVANLASALLLHRGSSESLNIKATYLHILSDALSSIGVIIGAVIIKNFHIYWVDPLMTMLVSLYIAYETIPLIIESTNILMEAGPKLDYDAIRNEVLDVPGVVNMHHVHTWMIDEHRVMLSAHINLKDEYLSEVEPVYRTIEKMLKDKFNIEHVTLQAEVDRGLESQTFTTKRDDV